jgi:hypothetical protein
MNLGTFGAVLKFAIQLENTMVQQYENIVNLTDDSEKKTKLNAIIKQINRRIANLKRIRSENTTEMILEPIYGLDGDNYALKLPKEALESFTLLKQTILEKTQILLKFYQEAGIKLEFLSEVAYTFEDFVEENNENLEEFKNL